MSRIKRISDKKALRLAERKSIVERVRIKYPFCALDPVYGCKTKALDVDEMIPKSDWAEAEYTFDNCWCLCRDCHDQKHHHEVKAAMIIGLYGRQRMLRYELTIEERLPYFDIFKPVPWDEVNAKIFLNRQLNLVIPDFKGY